jgi:hypothetical protein
LEPSGLNIVALDGALPLSVPAALADAIVVVPVARSRM